MRLHFHSFFYLESLKTDNRDAFMKGQYPHLPSFYLYAIYFQHVADHNFTYLLFLPCMLDLRFNRFIYSKSHQDFLFFPMLPLPLISPVAIIFSPPSFLSIKNITCLVPIVINNFYVNFILLKMYYSRNLPMLFSLFLKSILSL